MELSVPHRSLPTLLPNRTSITHRSPSLILPPRSLSSSKTLGLRCRDMSARATEETSTFVTEKFGRSPNDTAVDELLEAPSAEAVSGEKEEAAAVVDGEQSELAEFLSKLDIKSPNDTTVDKQLVALSGKAVSGEKEEAVADIDGEQSEPSEFSNKTDIKSPNDIAVDKQLVALLGEAVSGEKKEAVADVDGEQSEPAEFPNKTDIKLETGDTYSLIVYGTGALLALWLSSAVVGAVDSIPVVPKVMEAIGLAYTVWFSYRYLIFKENRDELLARIEDIKKEIIGTTDD